MRRQTSRFLHLAAFVLALSHDAGGDVRHAHGAVGAVDVLAARAARAVGVDAHILHVDFKVLIVPPGWGIRPGS